MEEPLKLRIRDINPHIVCGLCAGYFVEATTITECLHTFCKSCIVKCLQSSKHCPQCSLKIHETQPLMNLKPDRVMQDIVFKLVPGLYEGEEKRKKEFFKSRGLTHERKEESFPAVTPLTSVYDHPEAHHYKHDEQICMSLEQFRLKVATAQCEGMVEIEPLPPPSPSIRHLKLLALKGLRTCICLSDDESEFTYLPKKFARCSIRMCIQHVQLLLQKKLQLPKYKGVVVVCNHTVLEPEMTLKEVYITHWYGQKSPLKLFYQVLPDIASNSSCLSQQLPNQHPTLMT